MITPFFATKDNYTKFTEAKREANGYCSYCNRPMGKFHYLCKSCQSYLKKAGLEGHTVRFKDIGLATINYQQYLHTSFFKCNAPYQYRGKKEDRIKASIPEELINRQLDKLVYLYRRTTYTSRNKTYTIPLYFTKLVSDTQDLPNVFRRLLYNLLLIQISYHIERTNLYRTEAHYQSTLVNFPYKHLYQHRYKNLGIKEYSVEPRMKHILFQLEELTNILQPLLIEVTKIRYRSF